MVEMVITLAVVGILTGLLVVNFRSSATNATARHQSASAVVASIRKAQSMALAGSKYESAAACGYGVRYLTNATYELFVRTAPACSPDTRVSVERLPNSSMRFRDSFQDIYFELPYGKTYLGGDPSPGGSETIEITPDPATAGTVITITTAGEISMTN